MSQNALETDLETFARSAEEDATVIDVREPGEYVAGPCPAQPRPVETGAPGRA
jgi:rhodanese-related sulfurtransferase